MALWKGTVSFGLVAVPVQILPAVRSHRSAFRMLHAEDNSPVQRKMLCPEEKVFVHPEHQQRGYPLPDGGHVVVLDSELKDLEPTRSEDIEIESFVELGQVDPVFFDRPYYVLPAGPEKPYRLLVEALAESDKAGIAKFVMHTREHLVALRAVGEALCLQTMHFADEIRDADELAPEKSRLKREDIDAFVEAIRQREGDFEPGRLQDAYQKRIDKLIRKKKRSEGTVTAPTTEEGEETGMPSAPARDLIAVLEESLAESRKDAS